MGSFKRLVSHKQLADLCSVLKSKFPTSAKILNILNIELQGRFTEATNVKFYLYFKEAEEIIQMDDPFVVCTQTNIHSKYCVFVHILETPTDQMVDAFDKLIDWNRADVFGSIPQHFFTSHLQKLCLRHGGLVKTPVEGDPCVSAIFTGNFEVSQNDFKILSTSNNGSHGDDDVEVRSLTESDAEGILDCYKWERLHQHSLDQIKLSIRNLTSCGVYVNKELVSFGLLSPAGLINVLYTKPNFRKHGFAAKVLTNISRNILDMGLTPASDYEVDNMPSKMIHEKTGFEFVMYVNLVKF